MASLHDDEAPDNGLDAPLLERPSFRRLSSRPQAFRFFMGFRVALWALTAPARYSKLIVSLRELRD